ncbi:hypothetical protein, partial [Escherichia coli]|uniref:hypothetical protein n=1 Tax=Escherichia coli TaxID=562 RepID=UPI0024AF1DA2
AYADMGVAFFEVKEKSKADTVVSWQRSGTWIGLAIVPGGPVKCNAQAIWAKFDNAYGSSYEVTKMVYQIAKLGMHEFG